METRKVIKFGNSSHAITLPNKWIKENNIRKGDDVNLEEMKNSILLFLDKNHREDKIEINIDGLPLKIFNKKLISYYLKNYKFIKIKGKKVIDKLDEIRIFKEKLSSVEIFEIGSDYVLLKDLSDPTKLHIYDLIKKIIHMEKTLFDEVLGESRLDFISQLDSNINKLTFLAVKTINYNLDMFKNPDELKNSIHLWRIVSALEFIGDTVKRVARYMKNKKDEKTKLYTRELLLGVISYFSFITGLLNDKINLENNLKIYLDKKQSLLKEFEEAKIKFKDNINHYLLITQLYKDILGHLDTIILSIVDMSS